MAQVGINTNEYERQAPSGGPLPPGVYTMTVVRIQQKETNDKTGIYEEVEFDISSPQQFANRKFWDRFNILNKSEKAQKIGREGIADLAKASGIHGMLNDDQELLGKTVQARLMVKQSDNPQYPEPKNECRKYYPLNVNPDDEDKKAKGQAAASTTVAQPQANNWNNAASQAAAPATAQQIKPGATPPWGAK